MRHEAEWLRDYLVAGVEDPRVNLQSILARHFLVEQLVGARFGPLMEQEYRFSAVMNWLLKAAKHSGHREELAAVRYALMRGADNAEGLEIPPLVVQTFQALPLAAGEVCVPNYIESFLAGTGSSEPVSQLHEPALSCFQRLWQTALSPLQPAAPLPSVLEPACGSANDYRFLDTYGLGRLVNYTGFDLCEKNIENARQLFPAVRFELGDVFDIAAADKTFDLCVVHDLFEHLSLAGLEVAIREVCRVTRRGICAGFFQMDEVDEHLVRPVEEYYFNLLSMQKTRDLFARNGFAARVIHIDSFLRRHVGGALSHNPNAYTLWLYPESKGSSAAQS